MLGEDKKRGRHRVEFTHFPLSQPEYLGLYLFYILDFGEKMP